MTTDQEDFYDDYEPEGSWYCNHDVPDGCPACRQDRAVNDFLDNATEQERNDYLYDGGTFETYFAPGGPAWQKEEMERRGLR